MTMLILNARPGRRFGRRAAAEKEHLSEETVARFKVQGVKRKGRTSLGLTKGVGSIFYVPSPNGEAKRDFDFIGEDKDRQLESLWRETKIGDVLPWENAQNCG
jgi:hypothetical protein